MTLQWADIRLSNAKLQKQMLVYEEPRTSTVHLKMENQKSELRKPYLLVLMNFCIFFFLGVVEIGLSSCPHVLPFQPT